MLVMSLVLQAQSNGYRGFSGADVHIVTIAWARAMFRLAHGSIPHASM